MRSLESTMKRGTVRVSLFVLAAVFGGCSCNDSRSTGHDAGVDSGVFVPVDSGLPVDSGFDAGTDAGSVDAGDPDSSVADSGVMPVTCAPDQPNTCADAMNKTISVARGESMIVQGRVDSAGDDYFYVDFTSPGDTLVPYHPHIVFITNENGENTFDVLSACGTAATCQTGASADAVEFEHDYPATRSCNSDPSAGACFDTDTRVSGFIVRVHRATVPVNCHVYQLQVSNVLEP